MLFLVWFPYCLLRLANWFFDSLLLFWDDPRVLFCWSSLRLQLFANPILPVCLCWRFTHHPAIYPNIEQNLLNIQSFQFFLAPRNSGVLEVLIFGVCFDLRIGAADRMHSRDVFKIWSHELFACFFGLFVFSKGSFLETPLGKHQIYILGRSFQFPVSTRHMDRWWFWAWNSESISQLGWLSHASHQDASRY